MQHKVLNLVDLQSVSWSLWWRDETHGRCSNRCDCVRRSSPLSLDTCRPHTLQTYILYNS